MTTFSTQIFTCNHCNHKMYTYGLSSYHVYNSESYSDGFIDYNPPVMFDKEILICSNCRKEMWRDDIVFEEAYYSDADGLDGCKDVYDLPLSKECDMNYNLANYYSGLIESGFANTVEREVKLRIEIWHKLNANSRYGNISIFGLILQRRFRFALIRFKDRKRLEYNRKLALKLFKENLQKLILCFQTENDDDLLLLAEMYRENRNFKFAKATLKRINELSKTKAYLAINRAVFFRKSKVFKIN